MSVAASDKDVEAAVAEYVGWHRQALPSAVRRPPRVMVTDGTSSVLRRPFKSGGAWRVRWAGTARLVDPRRVDDLMVFHADWSRPSASGIR